MRRCLSLATLVLTLFGGCQSLDSPADVDATGMSLWGGKREKQEGGIGFGGVTQEARDIEKRLGIR